MAATIVCSAIASEAAPLRVDFNAEGRSDIRTEGWENWLLADGLSQNFGDVSVRLLSGSQGREIEWVGNKALVVRNITVGADAARVESRAGQIAAMEVRIKGLAPGIHSFTGYHHALRGESSPIVVSVGNRKADAIKPSNRAEHDDELATSFLEFDVPESGSIVIRLESPKDGQVILNGFSIDVSDARRKALKPLPANFERHADGDDGSIELSWKPAASTVSQQVYLISGLDLKSVIGRLGSPTGQHDVLVATVDGATGSTSIDLDSKSSRLHYAWRVDSIDAQGNVTPGDAWMFRVRHQAFPTAEGYGRFAMGGRGGKVLHVTNLNDSGPGSLRAAIEATGPRSVVFDVSGLISLKSKLLIRGKNEFLTVAGQTAPGKGICIRDFTFGGLGARDAIIRFIRLRLGNRTGKTMDGMGLASSDHCIVDHCSISWTIDEAFSSRQGKNITFQRNLISEALNIAGHDHYGKGSSHGFAGSINGNIGSFHHSLLAHNAGRNWSISSGLNQENRYSGRLDIRNMVVYNWAHRTTDGGTYQVQFVNNYYKPGPVSRKMTYLNPQFELPHFGDQQYFISGNIMEGVAGPEGPGLPLKGVQTEGQQHGPFLFDEPFYPSHVETHSAEEAYENVLANVGCNVPVLDDHDKRIIKEVRTGSFTYRGSKSNLPGLPDSHSDVGGWEDYPEIHRPASWDVDGDGMPGMWEREKGLNPDDPVDGALDPDGDGYTNLEDYLNWLAVGNQLTKFVEPDSDGSDAAER